MSVVGFDLLCLCLIIFTVESVLRSVLSIRMFGLESIGLAEGLVPWVLALVLFVDQEVVRRVVLVFLLEAVLFPVADGVLEVLEVAHAPLHDLLLAAFLGPNPLHSSLLVAMVMAHSLSQILVLVIALNILMGIVIVIVCILAVALGFVPSFAAHCLPPFLSGSS